MSWQINKFCSLQIVVRAKRAVQREAFIQLPDIEPTTLIILEKSNETMYAETR